MEENTHVNIDLEYGSDAIKTLDWKEHIRRRPGMYIGKLGDGSHADDGIYVLLKEVLDNAWRFRPKWFRCATTAGVSLSTRCATYRRK